MVGYDVGVTTEGSCSYDETP